MSLARAIETGDLTALPSRRDEDWRWTDIRGLVRVLPTASPASVEPAGPGPFARLGDAEVAIVNGRGPTSWRTPAGATQVLRLRFIATVDAGAHAARFDIEVEAGGRLVLLESYEGAGSAYVVEAMLDISLADDAGLERVVIADDSALAVSVSSAKIALARRADFGQTVLTTGARRQRQETQVSHPGGGARARLDGVYLLAEQRHADITTVVTHTGVDGTTNQLIKGVVDGQGRGVFQGRIVVRPGADRTDARMGHHALLLSDRAEVDAKPELEIHADDVSCAHGNTVGALDEESMFYAQARGIPADAARAMLTRAFVDEVVGRIDHHGARAVAMAWLDDQLGAVA